MSIVLILGLSACSSGQDPTMPGVVGRQLDTALEDIKLAGFKGDVDVSGGGMLGVIDKANWKVCKQSPEAGKPITVTPKITVDRTCDGDAPGRTESPSEAASDPTSDPAQAQPTSSEPDDATPLTAKTSPDLKRLLALTDQCSAAQTNFAEQYAGKRISFDGSIVAMNNHGDYKTRFDILINAGDYSATEAIPGPNFQFRDVNITGDLNLVGPNVPDVLGLGDNLRIVAQVDRFEPDTCLFLLEPVSTEVR